MAIAKVDIDELRKVAVEHRPDVSVWKVQQQAEELYKAAKLIGMENISAVYRESDFLEVEKNGNDISKRTRSLAAYLMMNEFQMSDSPTSIERLQKHFGEISMEASLGHLFGNEPISLKKSSNIQILEKYIGNGQIEGHYKEIWIKRLYDLVELKNPNVDLWTLWVECEKLYKSIITVGLENTTIWLYDNQFKKVILKGKEIPERIRAFALFIVVHVYRLRDDQFHMKQLQERYGLYSSVRDILVDTDIFRDNTDNLKCISLRQIVGRYLKTETAGKMTDSPICLQIPYDAIQMKSFDADDYEMLKLLWIALDSFYKVTKIVGIDNVKVRYIDASKKEIVQNGREVPARIRAFCEEVVIYMYRMNDSDASRKRLEQHLGLEYPSKYILGDTNVVSCNNKSLPCMSLRKLIKNI